MNQLTNTIIQENPYLSDQRNQPRQEVLNLLAITVRGTGQILDISEEGLSFGCLYPHTFPEEFYLDILDAQGPHIKKLKVKKIWSTDQEFDETSSVYELVVGVEFSDLTPRQIEELTFLLECMETRDGCSAPLVMV